MKAINETCGLLDTALVSLQRCRVDLRQVPQTEARDKVLLSTEARRARAAAWSRGIVEIGLVLTQMMWPSHAFGGDRAKRSRTDKSWFGVVHNLVKYLPALP